MSTRYSLRSTRERTAFHNPAAVAKRGPGPKKRRQRVPRLRNGLVSLLHTPEHLVEPARENSVNSPLLTLPAEIRTMIWDYAIGGMCIYPRPGRSHFSEEGSTALHDFNLDRQLALPRACRQIYSEVGTAFYRLNIITFVDKDAVRHFRNHLKRVQWQALDTIAVTMLLARELYIAPPPPLPKRLRARRPSPRPPGYVFDFFQVSPLTTFSDLRSPFHEIKRIIIYGETSPNQFEQISRIAKLREYDKDVVFQ